MTSAADKIERSERHKQILQLLADGKDRKEICELLTMSRGTLDTHIGRIYAKLGARKPGQAIAEYLRLKHPRLQLFG
jgi:DNA-binding CsgD family transcriptional regulator